ncbi:MAG: IspD/TarI family cytidylyltransferase [Mycoplasmoidaceae bacterium]
MNIAIILASGIGKRINSNLPKQYLKINNKTILEHCVNNFLNIKEIDVILIVVTKAWIEYVKSLFSNYPHHERIIYCIGGKNRNESILYAIDYLKKNCEIKNDDIILTHDATRIFTSEKIILDNITLCRKYHCVLTGMNSYDTIYKYKNNKIKDILKREELFLSQTPQTFTFKKIDKIIHSHHPNDFKNVDLGTLAFLNKEKIFICEGEHKNFKITKNDDLAIAEKILNK